jgi:hypothetical protein
VRLVCDSDDQDSQAAPQFRACHREDDLRDGPRRETS